LLKQIINLILIALKAKASEISLNPLNFVVKIKFRFYALFSH